MENKEGFHYTYSSEQQKEINSIRNKYVSPQESKMERLRRLDRSATVPGTVAALIVGVAGTIILGVGMCCCLVWMERWFIPGIIIGLIGIAAIFLAYPLYTHITRKRRAELAPEILKLTDELSRNQQETTE